MIEHRQYSSKSDVWSMGIVMWEIFEYGKVPYPTMSNEETLSQVLKGYRLSQPNGCPDPIYKLMLRCWAVNPEARPTFSQIFQRLSEEFAKYKKQDRTNDNVKDNDGSLYNDNSYVKRPGLYN